MKQVLIAFFSLILGMFATGGVAVLHAQTQPGTLPGDVPDITTQQGVAFVKAEANSPSRSILYMKPPNAAVNAYDIAAIVNQIYGETVIDSIRHLAVIGMTPNGSRLILGAEVGYLDITSGLHQVFAGIMQIPWPLTSANISADDLTTWFLQSAPNLAAFHPEGILSPDGTQWYATVQTSSPGSNTMRFYHGHITGGAVDSATITGDVTGTTAPQDSWNISNLALDTMNSTMLATEVDGFGSGSGLSERIMIIHWQPGSSPFAYNASAAIGGLISQDTIAALFGMTVAAVQDGRSIAIGLRDISDPDGTIEFYTTRYLSPDGNLAQGQTIPVSSLPDSTTFFAGANSADYQDDNYTFKVHAQGGDVILTNDGTTALFITHAQPDNTIVSPGYPRDVKSAIFSYDMNSSGSPATMLYNDSSAQELQPIFVPVKDTMPDVPDILASTTILKFGMVDTAADSMLSLTVTDTSSFDGTILDGATITGDNEFTIVSPKFPDTIMRNSSVQMQLRFSPVLPAGPKTATLTITSAMSVTKSLTISLNGKATVLPPNGVREDASLSQSMSIEPNPFSSIATVQLTAQDAGALGIVVHDALGRTVYTSPMLQIGRGGNGTFNFDAKSLGLPNGIYYVTALFGDRQVSRQVVFVR